MNVYNVAAMSANCYDWAKQYEANSGIGSVEIL